MDSGGFDGPQLVSRILPRDRIPDNLGFCGLRGDIWSSGCSFAFARRCSPRSLPSGSWPRIAASNKVSKRVGRLIRQRSCQNDRRTERQSLDAISSLTSGMPESGRRIHEQQSPWRKIWNVFRSPRSARRSLPLRDNQINYHSLSDSGSFPSLP